MTRISLLIGQMLAAGTLPQQLTASAVTPRTVRKERVRGSTYCLGCGKTISANKERCLRCQELVED